MHNTADANKPATLIEASGRRVGFPTLLKAVIAFQRLDQASRTKAVIEGHSGQRFTAAEIELLHKEAPSDG